MLFRSGGAGQGGPSALNAGSAGSSLNGGAGGANTGGGGGGGGWDGGIGGNGGSGIVIVRYVGSGMVYTDSGAADTFSNYTGRLTGTDSDNDSLTFGIANGVTANGLVTKVGTFGTLVVNASTGDYTYTPDAAAIDRKSTRLNSSHIPLSRMPSSA